MLLGEAPSLSTLTCCPSELRKGVFWSGGVGLKVDGGGAEGTGRWGRRTGRLPWFNLPLLLFSALRFNNPSRKKRYIFQNSYKLSTLCKEKKLHFYISE